MTKEKAYLSTISISIVFAAIIVTLTGFGIFGVAKGQANVTSITPQQKAAMCDPNSPKLKFVNSTESKICGLPKSVKSNTTASSGAPSVAPTSSVPGS